MNGMDKSQMGSTHSRWWKPAVGLAIAFILVLVILVPVMADSAAARAVLRDRDGDQAGEFYFLERDDNAVTVMGYLTNVPAGFHGFHLHEYGECDPPDFLSAGGHYNPGEDNHPHHEGDFPSPLVMKNGYALLIFQTDRFNVDEILSGNGTAVILHESPDNFANIPERYGGPDETTLSNGDSGDRIACGVVEETDEVDQSFLRSLHDLFPTD